MTPTEKAFSLAGGVIGWVVAAALGLPTALAIEDRARTRARRRAARLDIDRLFREQADREGGWDAPIGGEDVPCDRVACHHPLSQHHLYVPDEQLSGCIHEGCRCRLYATPLFDQKVTR